MNLDEMKRWNHEMLEKQRAEDKADFRFLLMLVLCIIIGLAISYIDANYLRHRTPTTTEIKP